MFKRAKLRGPIGGIYPIFFFSASVLAVVEIFIRHELFIDRMDIMQGPFLVTIISSLFIIIMGIYQWWRYHVWIYFGLGMLAGVLIWAKLRLVTDIPRSAYAEPKEQAKDQIDPAALPDAQPAPDDQNPSRDP